MSLKPEPIGPVPAETTRLARAVFPEGSTFMILKRILKQKEIEGMSETQSPSLKYFLNNPMNWPAEVLPVFEKVLACEFSTVTRQFTPLTPPLSAYPGTDEKTVDFTTGVVSPAKAERARRNPKVALLFSDAVGSNVDHPPIVLVQGHARVCDADMQGNTDR